MNTLLNGIRSYRYGPSPMFSLQGHIGCVNSALFSECGNYVFTGSDDTRVNVYNLHTGFLEESISTAHAGGSHVHTNNNISQITDDRLKQGISFLRKICLTPKAQLFLAVLLTEGLS